MKPNRIVLPSHNTGVAPGNETLTVQPVTQQQQHVVDNSSTPPTSMPTAAVPTAAIASEPVSALTDTPPPAPATSPSTLPPIVSSANSDVMALIRGEQGQQGDDKVPADAHTVRPQPQVTLQQELAMLDARLRVAETFAFTLDGKLSTHRQSIDDSLRITFGQIRDELTRIESKIVPAAKAVDYSQDIAALRASLNAIAAAHGIVVETASIRMKQRRPLTHPATLDGGYVVLHYNPKGDEPSEIHVRAGQPRLVWTGYSFDIPSGYVADVWSAGRLVASFTGYTGDGDYRIPVLGNSDAGAAVSTGREVARLSIRRIEPVALNVDRAGFGG